MIFPDCLAVVNEIVPAGSRGSADAVLAVALTNGAWEIDVNMSGFGLTPSLAATYAADVEIVDRIDEAGQPNGQAVAVVGLREV